MSDHTDRSGKVAMSRCVGTRQRCYRWLIDVNHWLPTETGKMLHYSMKPRSKGGAIDDELNDLINAVMTLVIKGGFTYDRAVRQAVGELQQINRRASRGLSLCGQTVVLKFDDAQLASAGLCSRCLTSPHYPKERHDKSRTR